MCMWRIPHGEGGLKRIAGSPADRVAEKVSVRLSILGVSDSFSAKLTDGLLDMSARYVRGFPPMEAVPQSAKDISFGVEELGRAVWSVWTRSWRTVRRRS